MACHRDSCQGGHPRSALCDDVISSEVHLQYGCVLSYWQCLCVFVYAILFASCLPALDPTFDKFAARCVTDRSKGAGLFDYDLRVHACPAAVLAHSSCLILVNTGMDSINTLRATRNALWPQ